MSIVAVPPTVDTVASVVDLSDPWMRGEAVAILIDHLEPVLTQLREVRRQVVIDLVAAKCTQVRIARHVGLTQQQISNIARAERGVCRG
ncbi:MAG: hypothetical protein JXA67_06465 [Micromonosporaceae bacterium]|nr:hypothetical protein [Micromonosporaceae bacterium]